MKTIVKSIFFKPPYVKWCSQTIYQALLGCIKLYEATREDKWKFRATDLLQILCDIQQSDGGFDIGYDFDFGLLHKKGESTSPEMVGLLAMLEYGRVFGFSDTLIEKCNKAVDWVVEKVINVSENEYYSPYAPDSTNEIMVYNGTSFVCGALGYYLGIIGNNDPKLVSIYEGMLKYLHRVLSHTHDVEGAFWYYYDQNRTDILSPQKHKIDHYHQMQQVEMHAYAQLVSPNSLQLEIIKLASLYVMNIFSKEGIVPYTNNPKDFGGRIHLWGFSSIISGLTMSEKLRVDLDPVLLNELRRSVLDFILEKGWKDPFFCPVLSREGNPVFNNHMVRSDAWVFNSIASLLSVSSFIDRKEELINILDKCYKKMKQVDFSGPETHASNRRTRFISSIINRVK